MPRSCCNAAPVVPQSPKGITTPSLNRAHRCLFLTTPATIKQNTFIYSYPFFNLSHRISYLCKSYDRKRFFQLLTHYTCIYLVLYAMSRSKRATHEYPSFFNPRPSVNYLQRIINYFTTTALRQQSLNSLKSSYLTTTALRHRGSSRLTH